MGWRSIGPNGMEAEGATCIRQAPAASERTPRLGPIHVTVCDDTADKGQCEIASNTRFEINAGKGRFVSESPLLPQLDVCFTVTAVQPYVAAAAAAASVSAPCRDQPCLTSATSALAPTDAPDTLHYTLPHSLRPTSPEGACLSLPRGTGYEHSTTRPLHTSTTPDTDIPSTTTRVIALHSSHFHISNKERPPATL